MALRRESKVPSEAATVNACVPASLVWGAKCRLPVVGPVVVTEAKLGPLSREKLSGVASGSDAVSCDPSPLPAHDLVLDRVESRRHVGRPHAKIQVRIGLGRQNDY